MPEHAGEDKRRRVLLEIPTDVADTQGPVKRTIIVVRLDGACVVIGRPPFLSLGKQLSRRGIGERLNETTIRPGGWMLGFGIQHFVVQRKRIGWFACCSGYHRQGEPTRGVLLLLISASRLPQSIVDPIGFQGNKRPV